MGEKTTCGQALVSLLRSYGVDTVFGIPGTHTLELYRGLADSGIRHVQARHEQGAGFMADGYARASGEPGVCLLISGPGVSNAATPIAQAYSDSVPVLVISSVHATADLGMNRGYPHELPSQSALMASITAFSATALSAGQVPDLVAKAFSVFESGRPRPVHIELPLDVIAAPVDFGAEVRRRLPPRPAANEALIAEAATLLSQASRPLIMVGGGAADHGRLVVRVAESVGARILTTIAAKGAVPNDHPLHLGSPLTLPAAHAFLAEPDVILAVGTEMAPSDTWVDRLPIAGRLIRVDIDPAMLQHNYPAKLAILADAGATLEALADALQAREAAGPRWTGDGGATALRASWTASLSPLQRRHATALDALREVLPEDGFVAADMTQAAYTANAYFACSRPRSYFYPVGFSTLGFALPAAIGAKIAAPDRPSAVVVGDGGFLFTATELATAVELGLSLAVILWNNHGLAQIRHHMQTRGIPEIGVSPRNPDFLALGRSFGCHAARPNTLAAFKRAVARALVADAPTIIEVRDEDPYLS